MAETMAAAVLHSLLPARSATLRASSVAAVSTFRSDFFTPFPRYTKGKQRSHLTPPPEACPAGVEQCQEWSCSATYPLWCPDDTHYMPRKLVRDHAPRFRRQPRILYSHLRIRTRASKSRIESPGKNGQRQAATHFSRPLSSRTTVHAHSWDKQEGPSSLSSSNYLRKPYAVNKSTSLDTSNSESEAISDADLCQHWSCRDVCYAPSCPNTRALLLQELVYDGRSQRTKRPHKITRQQLRMRGRIAYSGAGVQRRHASHTSEALRIAYTPPTIHTTHYGPLDGTSAAKSSLSMLPRSKASSINDLIEFSSVHPAQMNLQKAWKSYTDVAHAETLSQVNATTILSFAHRFIAAVERLYDTSCPLSVIQDWAECIHTVVTHLRTRIGSLSDSTFDLECMTARSQSLAGDVKNALMTAHRVRNMAAKPTEMEILGQLYTSIIRGTTIHFDQDHVLDILIDEWDHLGPYLMHRGNRRRLRGMTSLSEAVSAIITGISSPADVMLARKGWQTEKKHRLGSLMIKVLCEQNSSVSALEVMHEMDGQGLQLSITTQLAVVRALTKDREYELATDLFKTISVQSHLKSDLSTGLYLYAHQGDQFHTEKFYEKLRTRGWDTTFDAAMRVYAYSVQGLHEEAVQLFNEHFPLDSDGKRTNNPQLLHYSIVIFGYSQRGDFSGINYWLHIMEKEGYQPDLYVYNSILKGLALRGIFPAINTVLSQMYTAGIRPNVISYTIIISLLSRRKDPIGAEVIFKRAITEGIEPDVRMIAALMNAYAEAGLWKGVIRSFRLLNKPGSRKRLLRLPVGVYNTIIKAHVLLGAPYNVVNHVFSLFERVHVRPDAFSYALLIQSACDAGKMEVAQQLYESILVETGTRPNAKLVNAYILTILMVGFLRSGDKTNAKEMLDEMIRRDIQPTTITFREILRAYGDAHTLESVRIAEEFTNSLDIKNVKHILRPGTRGTVTEHLYGPLINAYAQQQRIEDMERVYEELLAAGGEPSIGILSTLMDAYRRVADVDAVRRIWPRIFEMGLGMQVHSTDIPRWTEDEAFKNSTPSAEVTSRIPKLAMPPRNVICAPLSIYIDALSAAGLHSELMRTWSNCRKAGFHVDSHNWNHLAVALIRAGDPLRAFEVLERVLLPRQRWYEAKRLQEERVDVEEVEEEWEKEEDSGRDSYSEPPLHNTQRRASTVRIATSQLAQNQRLSGRLETEDFTTSLRVFHRISPSWNVWRPHKVILSLLAHVLHQLEAGIVIAPKTTDGQAEDKEQDKADMILQKIFSECTEAVRVVMDFERMERQRKDKLYIQR